MTEEYPADWLAALMYAVAEEWDEDEMQRAYRAVGLVPREPLPTGDEQP